MSKGVGPLAGLQDAQRDVDSRSHAIAYTGVAIGYHRHASAVRRCRTGGESLDLGFDSFFRNHNGLADFRRIVGLTCTIDKDESIATHTFLPLPRVFRYTS